MKEVHEREVIAVNAFRNINKNMFYSSNDFHGVNFLTEVLDHKRNQDEW